MLQGQYRLVFFLIMCVLGTSWLLYQHQSKPKTHKAINELLEEYMYNVQVENFDTEGALVQNLQAHYWAFVPKEGRSLLEHPEVTVFKKDNTHWILQAQKGQAFHEHLAVTPHHIEFWDKVILRRTGNETSPMELQTEQLSYFPEKKFAESKQYVTLTKPGTRITGHGLKAYLDKGQVELLQDVTTYYE